jgi:hypothetical protein
MVKNMCFFLKSYMFKFKGVGYVHLRSPGVGYVHLCNIVSYTNLVSYLTN